MSHFSCPLIQIGKVGKHPNADSLSITQVDGCPVIFRTEDFHAGDYAVYVPVDAVVPETVPGTDFLGSKRRIRAVRLRGIFSMGLLLPVSVLTFQASPGFVGIDCATKLGITKYEEPEVIQTAGEDAVSPKGLALPPPVYDVESFRKWSDLFSLAELVVATEKIHGANARFVFHDGALHVGSHKRWKDPTGNNVWARAARENNLAEKLAKYPGLVFFGEVYGQVQDLRYGTKPGEIKLAFYDIYDTNSGNYFYYDKARETVENLGLDFVPTLLIAPMDSVTIDNLKSIAEGKTAVGPDRNQMREGVVIRPMVERWTNEIGRLNLKLVSEQYLTRKGGTEFH